jgi:hypothetical protein
VWEIFLPLRIRLSSNFVLIPRWPYLGGIFQGNSLNSFIARITKSSHVSNENWHLVLGIKARIEKKNLFCHSVSMVGDWRAAFFFHLPVPVVIQKSLKLTSVLQLDRVPWFLSPEFPLRQLFSLKIIDRLQIPPPVPHAFQSWMIMSSHLTLKSFCSGIA